MNGPEMVSTAQFNVVPPTRKKKPPPKKKSTASTKKRYPSFKEEYIEEVPGYPYQITTIENYLKKHPIKPPRMGEYVESYKHTETGETNDPYLYMGMLYKYSLKLQKYFERYGPDSLNTIIDRYKEILTKYISIPYTEKPNNIVYKIFMNIINNQLNNIQNIKIDIKENVLIRIEFNKKIRDDIKHLSELVNSNKIREYKIAFDAFNQMYFTDGIIDMLSEIYKKNTNRSNYGNMKQLKEDLFKKNILVTPQPRQSSRRTRSQQPKTQSQPSSTTQRAKTPGNKRPKLLNVVPGLAI
jgi:hypothetical protein